MTIKPAPGATVEYNVYSGQPGLDWGPFSVGIFMALVFLVLAFLPAVFLGLSTWNVVTGLIAGIIAALCTTSAIGVLMARRRIWNSEQRQAYIAAHGTLSDEKGLDEPMELK